MEVAQILLEKATGDLTALRTLAADQNQADHVVGFHAQQAVEKSIKAVLASHEIEIPMTHDLGYLATLVETPPREVVESRWLTPWAGGWRYDAESSPIDRGKAVQAAEDAVAWSEAIVKQAAVAGSD